MLCWVKITHEFFNLCMNYLKSLTGRRLPSFRHYSTLYMGFSIFIFLPYLWRKVGWMLFCGKECIQDWVDPGICLCWNMATKNLVKTGEGIPVMHCILYNASLVGNFGMLTEQLNKGKVGYDWFLYIGEVWGTPENRFDHKE